MGLVNDLTTSNRRSIVTLEAVVVLDAIVVDEPLHVRKLVLLTLVTHKPDQLTVGGTAQHKRIATGAKGGSPIR